ncbi:MAG: hypothetical protein ACI4RA_01570, partial [Kiritimatiellia bacterium]
MKKIRWFVLLAVCWCCRGMPADGVVQNVTARQLQPWQGLVEISYELTQDVVPTNGGRTVQTVTVQ